MRKIVKHKITLNQKKTYVFSNWKRDKKLRKEAKLLIYALNEKAFQGFPPKSIKNGTA